MSIKDFDSDSDSDILYSRQGIGRFILLIYTLMGHAAVCRIVEFDSRAHHCRCTDANDDEERWLDMKYDVCGFER